MATLLKRVMHETWKPVAVAGCVVLFQTLAFWNVIPKEDVLLERIKSWFDLHGLGAIAAIAFLENVVAFNIYFPGSIVILAGMGMTQGNPRQAFLTFLAITIPSQLAHVLNFAIGKFRSGDRAAANVTFVELILAFWHPQTASIASLRCGDAGWPARQFFWRLPVAAFSWHTFWAVAMYFAGAAGGSLRWLVWLFYGYLLLWVIQGLSRATRDSRCTNGTN